MKKLFLLLSCLFLIGCSPAKKLSIPFPPNPNSVTNVTAAQLQSIVLPAILAADPNFYQPFLFIRGANYGLPTSPYVSSYNNWFFNSYQSLGLGYSAKNDVVCESYSSLYASLECIEADNNSHLQLAIGSMIVEDVNTNMNVIGYGTNGNIYHAVDLFVTEDNGIISLYVCEPQNGEQCLLKDYTNSPYIYSIEFF